MTTIPQDPMQAKLKAARAEMEDILRKHDIAGHIVLHAPGWTEIFWSMWPSYSILRGDFPTIRITSVAGDYAKDLARMESDRANTAQMVNAISVALASNGLAWLELDKILTAQLGATHTTLDHIPDPSRLNTGGMH